MEDEPLTKWFIRAMALLAVAGMTVRWLPGAGFVKDELRAFAVEQGGKSWAFSI